MIFFSIDKYENEVQCNSKRIFLKPVIFKKQPTKIKEFA